MLANFNFEWDHYLDEENADALNVKESHSERNLVGDNKSYSGPVFNKSFGQKGKSLICCCCVSK
jgi:hypothetical protein